MLAARHKRDTRMNLSRQMLVLVSFGRLAGTACPARQRPQDGLRVAARRLRERVGVSGAALASATGMSCSQR